MAVKKKREKKRSYFREFLKVFIITVIIGGMAAIGIFIGAVMGLMGSIDEIDVDNLTLDSASHIYYIDPDTDEEVELQSLNSSQNRVWVNFSQIPQEMKDAIVSIEDERFYSHSGFDVRRTVKAAFAYIYNKVTGNPTSFGGSTITQQLVKNITNETEQNAMRKIQEISRAVNLEKRLSKDQILELYLNSIYLSQGCNGVQTAANKYFGKDVSELTLAECASIAGITQFPTYYDPIVNPENNKEKQEIVLSKMFELGYITQEEYDKAVNDKLEFKDVDTSLESNTVINSYFVDQVISDVLADLQAVGYSETMATKLLYSGGLKIVSTYNPYVQEAIDEVYADKSNFPGASSSSGPESSIVVMDPYSGAVVGMYGGIGQKTANRTLNRATQITRQPGSTIKPIAVYAPALEEEVITPMSLYNDIEYSYDGWTPQNYSRTFKGVVTVKYAIEQSLNTVASAVVRDLGARKSFDFLKNNLGVTTLVEEEERADGKIYSDIGLAQLALGGLTDGISPLELTAAYAPFVNEGIYTKPYTYTSITDASGEDVIVCRIVTNRAMSDSTAYIMTRLLNNVVSNGTGRGAQLANEMFTAGKTGTTSENYDRWFVGFTPYYVTTVWYGYDTPRPITQSGNPCIPVWKKIMDKIHIDLDNVDIEQPESVSYTTYCSANGELSTSSCPSGSISRYYFDTSKTPYCSYHTSGQKKIGGPKSSNTSKKSSSSSSSGSSSKSSSSNSSSSSDDSDDSSDSSSSGSSSKTGTSGSGSSGSSSGASGTSGSGGSSESSGGESIKVVSDPVSGSSGGED